jgi:hypothetical protein
MTNLRALAVGYPSAKDAEEECARHAAGRRRRAALLARRIPRGDPLPDTFEIVEDNK